MMTTRTAWNRLYYGRDLAARQIVMDMEVRNQGADPLREVLTRYGSSSGPAVAAQIPPPGPPPASGPMPAAGGPVSLAPVQQQPLPPPRR